MGGHGYTLVFVILFWVSIRLCDGVLTAPLSLESGEGPITHRTPMIARRSLLDSEAVSMVTNDSSTLLLAFRHALTNDPRGALKSWNLTTTPNFCKWVGITCNQAGDVRTLNLAGKGLVGHIPPLLASLGSLSTLNLGGNNFSGPIPRTLGSLRRLEYLILSRNSLSGSIPVEIFNCSSMIQLSMSENNLSGGIPSQLGLLRNLSRLDLSENQLGHSIPRSVGNCSLLRELSLGNSGLGGIIPEELGRLHKLAKLNVSYNSLAGQIPRSLANCSLLDTLHLNNNNLTGHILPELGSLQMLTLLHLYANFLTGPLPKSLGNLSSLHSLKLGANPVVPLSGSIPPEFGRMQSLQTLVIYKTNLTGSIPSEIGNLTKLQYLFLTGNMLTGPIPQSLGNLQNLATLELDGNQFTGGIPPSLGNMGSLGWLGLRLNLLTGHIPSTFGNLTRIWRLLFSHNMLSGPFVPELGNLTSVRQLGLDSNFFEGELPASVGNLVYIESLYLQNNFFSGLLPSSLMSGLTTGFELHLNNNNFTGSIPPEVGDLIILQVLDLSFNRLSGPIPEQIKGCKNLQALVLSNNHLSGELPLDALEHMNLSVFSVANNSFYGPIPAYTGIFERFNSSAYAGNPGLCGPLLGVNCSSTFGNNRSRASCSGISTGCHQETFYGLITAGAIVPLLGAFVVAGFLCYRRAGSSRPEGDLQDSDATTYDDEKEISFFTESITKKLTIEDLRAATDGFCRASTIGVGGQSIVFKAILPKIGGKVIAVKVLNSSSRDSALIDRKLLLNEVKILANIRHRNLVSFYGFCTNPELKALFMEYVANGTLHSHLHPAGPRGKAKSELGLQTRIQIAAGVANALCYLHHESRAPVIHRDLKPSNILLDHDFNPKVSDFGISLLANPCYESEASASYLCGTIGYIPPEYAASNRVSTGGDVYSFGIILLELLTGKCPTDDSFENGDTIVSWVSRAVPERIADVLDSVLIPEVPFHEAQLQMLLRIGLICTGEAGSRPSMQHVQEVLISVKEKGKAASLAHYPTWEELAIRPSATLEVQLDNSKCPPNPASPRSPHDTSISCEISCTPTGPGRVSTSSYRTSRSGLGADKINLGSTKKISTVH